MAKAGSVKQFLMREILKSSDLNNLTAELGGAPFILHDATTGARLDGALGDPTSGSIGHLITDLCVRNGRALKVYDAAGALISSTNWSDIGGGGGGAGGGGLESLELANEMEKAGRKTALPTNKAIRNAFTSATYSQLFFRKSYTPLDKNIAILDGSGTDAKIRLVNDFQTTANFTAGTSTPTVATDSVKILNGTQSVKFTATNLNGSADMYEAEVTSFSGQNLVVSVNPDTLSNVTYAYVVAYTSSGNQRRFNFPVAQLTANVWNHLTCDFNADVDGTIIVDTGTFVRGTITRIYYGITTSSTQTVIPSWSLARTIDDHKLLPTGYGKTYIAYNNSTSEPFTLVSEDRTNNTTKGKFTFTSMTKGIYFDANFVTSNNINLTINDTAMTTVPFNATNAQTYTDLKTQLETDYSTLLKTVTIDATNRYVVLVPKEDVELTITDIVVTGGSSQANTETTSCLAGSYTNASATDGAADLTATISNNQMIHKSTGSGRVAKHGEKVDTLWLSTTVDAATAEAFVRFYDKGWPVTAFNSTTEMEVYSLTDDKARLPSGMKGFLVKRIDNFKDVQSPEGSHTINFKYLTVTGTTSYSSPTMTITTTESNSIGADADDYVFIPESATILISAGGKTNGMFTKMTPVEILMHNKTTLLEESFTAANGTSMGGFNNWFLYDANFKGGTYSAPQIQDNRFYCVTANAQNNYWAGVTYRNLEGYKDKDDLDITLDFYPGRNYYTYSWKLGLATAVGPTYYGANSGVTLSVSISTASPYTSITFTVFEGTTSRGSVAYTCALDVANKLKLYYRNKKLSLKAWIATNDEPANFTQEFGLAGTNYSDGDYLSIYTFIEGGALKIDNLNISRGAGYSVKYQQEVSNVDKIETILDDYREDTSNQNPIILSTGLRF